jgi:hypothetical protein
MFQGVPVEDVRLQKCSDTFMGISADIYPLEPQ